MSEPAGLDGRLEVVACASSLGRRVTEDGLVELLEDLFGGRETCVADLHV